MENILKKIGKISSFASDILESSSLPFHALPFSGGMDLHG